ncbi:vWA domain-containing protein [Aliiroseovarius crassostreae]|uniref:vWA domain-containing protein n=1 Tax=Aliiroseovarius crassostreae TaxID=154981 RepID=UPI003C79B853
MIYGKTVRAIWLGFATAALTFTGSTAFAEDGQQDGQQNGQTPDLMVVFDASGSMWGQVGGTAKIEIARDVFSDMSADWASSGQSVGLIAYGHRRKGDCSDIELVAPPSAAAAASLADVVNGLTPRGKTPLSQAVRMAAEELKFTENAATVVLLSDGKETCDLDPCAVGAELERLGVNFTAHVIGFDIRDAADKAQLQCLAENTGGTYVDARDAATLSDAFTQVTNTQVTKAWDAPTGITSAHVTISVTDGTARPAAVTLTATEADTGETRALGQLSGADQVLTGLKIDLPQGNWRFAAQGDGGAGEVEVALGEATQEVSIPFAASTAAFALTGSGPFATDGTIEFKLRSLKPLQQNATYSVMLFPAGATAYDQNVTFSYRFGSDPETTEHSFYPWEYDLAAGPYEIIVMGEGYDLADNLGRFPITLVEPGAIGAIADETDNAATDASAPEFTLSQLIEPIGPGTGGGLRVEGPIATNDQVMFIGLDGQDSQMAGVPDGGLILVPPQTQPGTYRLQLLRADGTEHHLDVIDILPASAQDMGDHAEGGETAQTMLSDEELAAENGPQTLPFEIWKTCEGDAPCRIQDRRVALEWAMPAGWASDEPFYYTTAGGAQADHPTVHMGRVQGGAFTVALNPRQWDAQLGPCVEVPQGMLCHEATDVLRDQTDFELIYFSFHGEMPRPDGWLPLERSWTVDDKIMGGTIGLMKITEPEERAGTITVQLMLSNPGQFGLQDRSVAEAELRLGWDNRPVVTSMDGTVSFADGKLDMLLSRPGGWDGTSNQWSGQITNSATNQTAFVKLY